MNNTRLFIKYISYTLFVLLSFSCNDEDKITEKSIIKVIVNTDKTVLTKSGNTMDEVILRVEPLDNNGVITEYTLTEEEESEITIEPGQYVITAIVGKDTKGKPSVDPYYQGSETINVSSGETKNIQIECKLTTVVIGVDYSNITSIYNGYEYETIVSTTTGEQIVFSQDDTNKNGYFLPGSLNVTFRYGNNGNWKSEQMDDITNVMPQHKYIITYSIRDDSNDEGAAGVGITISDIDDRGEQQIQIELPKVSYFIEDIEQENIGDVYALIYGTAELNNGQSLSDGIYFEYSSDNDLNKTIQAQLVDGKWMAQLENLSPATKYKVWFKGNEETVKEFTTESVTLEPSPWAYFAFLYGKYSKAGEEVKFEYKSSSSSWIQVPAILRTDGTYYASISGLIPGGEYQYRLVTTEGMEGNIVSFKAEEELQLPNAGFENWQKPKNPWLIYGTDEDIFWDSGNHGATTLSASGSVTTPVESPKHSGVYAAQLKSRGVWALFSTIFAGGNMFTGEYIGTSGTSGAILDFGRPFETRPSKLTGWYKYAPGVIDYSNTSGMSDELKSEGVAKGDTDKAHIWVVLGNWTVAEGQKGPVRINNASRPGGLYDYKTDENVIAYGELVQTTATSDDNLIPFEIKLNYFNLERKPTHIIIVCSASKYADYFTGSTSSTLWLDDFELIYDDSPLTN